MWRVLRDSWSGRGGLALDELHYEPVPVDAAAGPIREPATRYWPRMVSVTDAIALLVRNGCPSDVVISAGVLHLLLGERAGGYHARLPADLPEVDWRYDELRRDTAMVDAAHGYAAMAAVGLVESSSQSLVLLRPPSPGAEDLSTAWDAIDRARHDPALGVMGERMARLAWEAEHGNGTYATRFRELARCGRLRAIVHHSPPATMPADPQGVFTVGSASLPALGPALATTVDEAHAARGWVSGSGADYRDRPDAPVERLPLGPYEAGALLLKNGVGANAIRRAWRATGLWMVLLELAGTEASIDTTVAGLAGKLAPYFGLAVGGDHRSIVSTLLRDLERVGLVTTARPARKTLRVSLSAAACPDDDRLRHFLGQFSRWRLSGAGAASVSADPLLVLAESRTRRVRADWVRMLEHRSVAVEVLP